MAIPGPKCYPVIGMASMCLKNPGKVFPNSLTIQSLWKYAESSFKYVDKYLINVTFPYIEVYFLHPTRNH